MSKHEYFVIDGSGLVSFSIKDEEPEAFATFSAAKRRARGLAKSEPGGTVVIAQSVAFVTCEVSLPKVAMRERKLRA
jgi:hypothetical protein